ncbi:MAG: cation transporter [Alphaproteobacteria bacterium]|nr:cation transporter [Alphaproteobacteria bacterium]
MAAHCHDDHCHEHGTFEGASATYRRVLWLVIALNATMFGVEAVAGALAGSMALQADALDFAADAATYGLSLWAIGRSVATRSTVALAKGASLAVMAAWVLGATAWRVLSALPPEPVTMGAVGVLALAVNVGSALLLYRWRDGDANIRSVWLCTRNDAIGNVAVMGAAAVVAATASAWPDLVVAAAMSGLFLTSSIRILRQAVAERRRPVAAA